MDITFFIGNGFDINLGLKTRYSDFYEYYKEHATETSIILQWMIGDPNKENWADLETALGRKLEDLDENNVDLFTKAHGELDELLLDYLEDEQMKYIIDSVKDDINVECY